MIKYAASSTGNGIVNILTNNFDFFKSLNSIINK